MSEWSNVDRSHVLAAVAECDKLGSRDFLSRYRFGRAKASSVWHGGQEYDVKAILGYSLLLATGRAATKDDFDAGEGAAARMLTTMGFDVVVDEEAIEAEDRDLAARALGDTSSAPAATKTRVTTPRKTAAAKKTAAPKAVTKLARPDAMQQPANVCPTCYMAVPMTGICDNCG